jgi:hypothetical protein
MRLIVLAAFFLVPLQAHATDCPEGLKSCKVLILTPEEENLLTGKNGILDTAMQARQMDLGRAVTFFYQKIATAPAGTVKEESPKPAVDPAPKADVPVPAPDPRK